jgi:hypothetical protein
MSYQKRFYLTGSINQPTVEDAFAFVGSRLQPGVTRVPDGEPGDRANWVLTQTPAFLDDPTLDHQHHAVASHEVLPPMVERVVG